jgi:hypothetical protein
MALWIGFPTASPLSGKQIAHGGFSFQREEESMGLSTGFRGFRITLIVDLLKSACEIQRAYLAHRFARDVLLGQLTARLPNSVSYFVPNCRIFRTKINE